MENILEQLTENYLEEQRIAAQLKAHAKEVRYDFLRKKLEKMSEEDLGHAKYLEEKIKENGGSLPAAPTINEEGGRLRDKLCQDLMDKWNLRAQYIERSNQLIDEQEELAKALRRLAAAEKEHQSVLLEILMKINP